MAAKEIYLRRNPVCKTAILSRTAELCKHLWDGQQHIVISVNLPGWSWPAETSEVSIPGATAASASSEQKRHRNWSLQTRSEFSAVDAVTRNSPSASVTPTKLQQVVAGKSRGLQTLPPPSKNLPPIIKHRATQPKQCNLLL